MWILKSKHDASSVSLCLPVGVFSIGRIECSLNITDDKSVSRKHAQFTVKSASELTITDLGSKFGTLLNGQRLASDSETTIKDGDSIKFGGLQSEFTIKMFPVCVFLGELTALNARNQLASLASEFCFSLSSSLTDSSWNFLVTADSITEVTPGLLAALARSASIVRFEYFAQLSKDQSNNFSEALMQPSCPFFPPKCLLPRMRRCEVLCEALAGVRQLICLQERDFKLLSALQEALGVSVILAESVEKCRNVPYCDMVVLSGVPLVIEVDQLTRAITAQSLIDAFLHVDSSLLRIESLYPSASATLSLNASANEMPVPVKESNISKETIVEPIRPSEFASKPLQLVQPASFPNDFVVESSPVIVQQMPASLLRSKPQQSSQVQSATNQKRFVKCHPKSRAPNSIPLLYGPHQLQPTVTPLSAQPAAAGGGRKRVLIKDSWLAEDDEDQKDENSNDQERGVRRIKAIPASTSGVNARTSSIVAPLSSTTATATTTSSAATTTNTPSAATTTNTAPASKFKSSFFQNLQQQQQPKL